MNKKINIDKNKDGSRDVNFDLPGDVKVKIHIEANGDKIVSENDQPSIESDDIKIWTNKSGNVHRLGGPAVINTSDDTERYFINSKILTKEEFEKHPDVIEYKLITKNNK